MDESNTAKIRRIRDTHAIFSAGLRAVQADRLFRDVAWRSWAPRDIRTYERVVVAGMGKASMALAGEVEAQLGDRLDAGVAVVPSGHPKTFPDDLRRPDRIELLEAAHPVPDQRSVAAARRILETARACAPDDLLLVLISGGGSALCADFEGAVTLEEAQETFRLLLESGADIHAINTVRKHISRIGGGRLAAAAGGSDVLTLVVSDVVGDDLSVIASGPTVPDPTTADEALEVLRRFQLWRSVPPGVRRHLEAVRSDASLETPDAASGVFDRVRTKLLGTNRIALAAAAAEAERLGYAVEVVSHEVTGEAKNVGRSMAQRVLESGERTCQLWGGETTVVVRGDGKGGRNQELALAAAITLEGGGRPVVLLSGGTDGRDGPTPAAGAFATDETAVRARRARIEPEHYLERNDSYRFWKQVGGLVTTGPTHTNVMDLQVAIVGGGEER